MTIARNALRTVVLAVLAAVALQGCGARGARLYRLVPVPDPAYTIESGAVSIRSPGFRLHVMPLDDLARTAFIRARSSVASDPFGPAPGGEPRYLTFQLSVENIGAKEPITFQPQSIVMAQENGERLFPLDYPEAYRRLAGGENTDPRLLDDLSKYLFDVGVSLSPGERIERLLVYPAERLHGRRLRMEFSFLEAFSSSTHYDVIFVKEP